MKKEIVKNIFSDQKDNNIALTSENNSPLLFKDLKDLANKISRQLSGNQISNKDRAAIILPNGPYMASSFLAISSYMSAAPLNPNYKSDEYEFYLNDLKPKIVLVEPNSTNSAVVVAKKLKIPICEIKIKKDQPTGFFDLFNKENNFNEPNENDEALVLHTSGTTSRPKIVLVEPNSSNYVVGIAKKLKIPVCEIKIKKNQPTGFFDLFNDESDYIEPEENDEALVLHTSGTTSRPKIVPLTNKNIYSSSLNISKSLNLLEEDHCLNIMPLFHIHGLIAIIASSMKSGASVCASNGFNALKFLELAKSEKNYLVFWCSNNAPNNNAKS
jgi:acyl-CoA synthetase (AMP-forming)/AMP-acid ligase II